MRTTKLKLAANVGDAEDAERRRVMELWITRPGPSGEHEVDEAHALTDGGEDAADAILSMQPPGWCEATVRANGRAFRRRLPRSGWVEVRHWPANFPKHDDRDSFGDDIRAVAQWLRTVGVGLLWENVMRVPWAGRERGDICGDTCPAPNEMLRSSRRKKRDALEAIVELVMQEGIERGALLHREITDVDELRRQLLTANAEVEELHRELQDALKEVRRLKGQPEVSEEEQKDAVLANVAEILGRPKAHGSPSGADGI